MGARNSIELLPTPNKYTPVPQGVAKAICDAAEAGNVDALKPLVEQWAGNTQAIEGVSLKTLARARCTHKHKHTNTHTHTHTHARTHTQVHIHTRTHPYRYTQVHKHILVHIINTHTY